MRRETMTRSVPAHPPTSIVRRGSRAMDVCRVQIVMTQCRTLMIIRVVSALIKQINADCYRQV